MRAASSSCSSGPPSSASSARAWPADRTPGGDATLHGDRQPQQADHVGDQRPRPTDARRQFVVGDLELVEQLLIGRRLFKRVQLCAVDVLQQCVAQHAVVGGLPHDRRDGGQARLLGRAPATLPHHQLVPALAARTWRAPRSVASVRTRGWSARARRARPRRTPVAAAAGCARSTPGRSRGRRHRPRSASGAPPSTTSAAASPIRCPIDAELESSGPVGIKRGQSAAEAAPLGRGHRVCPL